MAKVVGLRGEPVFGGGEADAEVVALLERWLDQARSGELVGIATAGYYRDRSCGARWGGTVSRSLVGECFALMQRMTNALNG